jgi:4-amino-4-deoxy-L-arabinose transferase-like glycosyltransferase
MTRDAAGGPTGTRDLAPPGRRLALAIGVITFAAVMATLDGPGLTIDEPLDVRPGRTYVQSLMSHGWRFFRPEVVDRVYRDNAEHPPLGRWLLGIASTLGEPFEVLWKGPDPTGQYVLAGRLAPALAFSLLAGTVSHVAGRRWRLASGMAAGFALVAMPRVFAHAHLAALDTFLSLFWTWAVLAGERAIASRRPIFAMAAAGAVWSLALLTKIHAWFLLPILGAWSLINLPPRRALAAWSLWALVGTGLFWVGWPWIWYDTWARLQGFWGTGVIRSTIFVQYFGAVVADRDVPWHYPWFYFAVTVPIGLQALGFLGVVRAWQRRRQDPFPLLLIATILVFLAIFSTRVPVYDGERLFLLVFPSWALLIGRGFGWLWYDLAPGARGRVVVVGFLLAQAYGTLSVHPFGLSYYNALVGGLPGAERLGLELTYWNDCVDQKLLDELARRAEPGATAALVPSLYPGQGILTTNRALWRRDLILLDQERALDADWLVVSRRTAYWRPEFIRRLGLPAGRRVAVRSRQGVWLGALWQFPRRKLPPSL